MRERERERESTRGSVKQDCGIHQTHTRLTTRVSAATSHVTAALSLSSYERNFNTVTHTNAHREKNKQTTTNNNNNNEKSVINDQNKRKIKEKKTRFCSSVMLAESFSLHPDMLRLNRNNASTE